MRLMLFLGIIEGHFIDVKTWDGLRRLHSNPSSSRLRIKNSSQELPVLRAVDSYRRLQDSAMGEATLATKTARSGRMAGLREHLNPLCRFED